MKYATAAALLIGVVTAAHAATDAEIKKAFAQAQKKGAVAVMENRCGGNTSVYFPGGTKESIAKTSAALAALATMKVDDGSDGCAAGMHPGDSQVLELYPDGTVKAH
jgi:hypothetical protein